ncbi:Spo0E family sporulation regulatory protein-aspartic acid phosphatase [Cohnella silvisoli]|uniref:Spo0E family sporulation regulatory protein-aspartic acid phosphatase n=1 Tax=Cohnella silvisoli TaxID=2873699 RepID=A0ABV1KSD6_9BACL|nr:Spo0E family sporulation regulatory protein-aspartic acid phosphatase [Cohnella silvisoli]MCD9022666.1 aspartyl-phosphate phosphatase Spo0E family protein [Cohnella silvisoli]
MTHLETSQLIRRLQLLQRRLCEMANDLGNLTDPEIVAVSEEADSLIIQLQRLRKEEAEYRKMDGSYDDSVSVLTASQSTEEVGQQSRAFLVKHS